MLSTAVAQWLVWAMALYALIGLAIAVPFVARGAGKIDPSATHGSVGFKLAILPGCIALWPIVATLWRRGRGLPERNAHRNKAQNAS